MPIVKRVEAGETEMLAASSFSIEVELEDILAERPALLSDDGEPPIALVQRQFGTRAGPADLLLVDADGLPIVVEVKLAKNKEIRRQVVGQVFDYVSELASLTVDELDEKVDGSLQEAMRSLVGEENDNAFITCWKACGVNLRAGKARVIVATDQAPEGLVRIIRFLNEHSDLDVRLVELRQYPNGESGETIFVPSLIVYTEETRVVRPSRPSGSSDLSGELQAFVKEYRRIAPADFSIAGYPRSHRTVIAPGWNKRYIHYEFIDWRPNKDKIGVEIHLEGDSWSERAVNVLGSLEPKLTERFPSQVEWEPNWKYGRRLAVMFDLDTPPNDVAEAAVKIIEHSWQSIDEVYKQEDWIDT